MNNITSDGRFDFEELLKVPIPSDIERFDLQKDDIIFNNTNSLDLIGKTAIVNERLPYTFSNHLTRIRLIKNKISPYWLYLIFLRYKERFVFRAICHTHVGQSGIGKNELQNLQIFFPRIMEQQKIASILSKVDELIQKTDQVIEQTQGLKKGLMHRLLTKGIGHTKFKVVKFGSHFKDEIPAEWVVDVMKKVSSKLVVGFVGTCDPYYTDSNGVPMIRTTNVKEGYLNLAHLKYVTREFHEKNKKSQLKINDLLVARHGENGEACLVRELKEANCLSVVIVRPDPSLWIPEFFELAFNSNVVRKQISRSTGGGVQTVVNTSEIGKAQIFVPTLDEQRKIVSYMSVFDKKNINLQSQLSNLLRLKKALMQGLLTGKIRVKV